VRALAPLVVCACTSTTVPAPQTPTVESRCVVHDDGVGIRATLTLELRGKRFAEVRGANDVVLEVSGARAAVRVVTTEDVELAGDVELAELRPRPKSAALIDGWYRIRSAAVKNVIGGDMVLEPYVPREIQLVAPLAPRLPCRDLTLADPPERAAELELAFLQRDRKIALSRAPGGAALATIVYPRRTDEDMPDDLGPDVRILERSGNAVRVRIAASGNLEIEGWVEAADLDEDVGVFGGLMGDGGFGLAEGISAFEAVRCPHEVPIYVRDRDAVYRVGRVRRNGVVQRSRALTPRGEYRIDLGGAGSGAEPFLQALAEGAALADCTLTR
jgi:hypothetical protein